VEQIDSAGLVAAVFDHRTSRAGDPQLHTHALVLNKVRCADGRWRTLDATELFHHKKSAGMIYQAALRNELHQRLGVIFREVNENGQADLAGVPDELLKLWSKRTASIDAEARPKIAEYEKILGRTLSSSERVGVVKTAVLKTRAAKQHGQLSALHATWTGEAAQAGWTPDRLRRAVRLQVARTRSAPDAGVLPTGAGVLPIPAGVLPNPPAAGSDPARPAGPVPPGADRGGPQHAEPVLPAPPAVLPAEPTVAAEAAARLGAEVAAGALQAAGARRAVFSRADVDGQVAAQLPTTGLSAAEVVARIEQLTDAALGLDAAIPIGQQTIGVTARASDARYATVQVLTAEARILDLAARGQRSDFGRVPLTALMPKGRDGRLDPSQYRAVLQLAGGGDFVSVLTAPAGAGKTSTLGAAARAWQDAGYRVVGLAPSARAAAELSAATGGPADTLAKWLHTHRTAPPTAQDSAELDGRTVVILDEASMASTLDLDPLITAAGRAGAKVVLVGDPAQIGVVNGPGGMLAALARAGHGVELNQIHRFSHTWERSASLALRDGTPGALAAYRLAGRLHPCADGDTALDGVFAHWAAARADGQDALMLARTRLDVDALNLRARAAALAAGEIAGPVTVAGERQWQAGDLLRTRRNDRRLTVGRGHVRNGDRYRVLGPGPDGALLVEDLSGRGRTILPAAYLAEHADYGWASTIDGAQGATADVGIVLARPGLDREQPVRRDDPRPARQPRLHHPRPQHRRRPPPRPARPPPPPAGRAGRGRSAGAGRASAPSRADAQRRPGRRPHRTRAGSRPGCADRPAAGTPSRKGRRPREGRRDTATPAGPAAACRARPRGAAARAAPGRTQPAARRPRRAAPRPAPGPDRALGVAALGPQPTTRAHRHHQQQPAAAAPDRADPRQPGRRGRPIDPPGQPPHPPTRPRPHRLRPPALRNHRPDPGRRAGLAAAGCSRRPRPVQQRPGATAGSLPRA
jgi:hypothetical protein